MWDYWLGGKDNYAVDRKAGAEAIRLYPELLTIARQARAVQVRAVRYLAGEAGVRQFLDIGTGLPTMQNTHEVAQSVVPESKIVYVDNDPVVLAHARALLVSTTATGQTDYVDADVRNPELLISNARTVLDFDEPIAVMLMGILGHACSTAEQVHVIIDRLVDAVSPGSYLIVLDGVKLGPEGHHEASRRRNYHLRTVEEFRDYFRDLELVEPGVVPLSEWRPDPVDVGTRQPLTSYCGVARKP